MAQEKPSNATVARIVLVVAGVSLLLYGLYAVRQILVLVAIALFLAIGLDPFVRRVMRLKVPRGAAVAIVFLAALIFMSGFIASITPPLVRQTTRLAREIPDFADRLSNRSDTFGDLDERFDISDKLRKAIDNAPDLIAGSAGRAVGAAKSIAGNLFNGLTVLVLTIYFLLDLPKLFDGALLLFAKSRRERLRGQFDVVFRSISQYIVGNIGISIIAGVTSFIALSIIGVPYALPLAMWVAIADLIPMVGATLGAIAPVIVAYFTGLSEGIITTVYFAAYQQFENYFIAPRVMRQAVNISAAAVLLSALIGATLLGFVGALVAIPIAASIKIIGQQTWLVKQEAA